MDTTVADTLLGSLIDGRYRISGRVARGGMATVYTALDERLERTVALKIIHPSQATNVHFVDRFTDEAKTIARLTHPNVVAVYDQGRHEGLPYLVMEFVQGRTLRELLAQRRRLNPGEALAILEQMLSAIAAAHRAGLVHRDVKPENVLVAEAPSGGVANLVDCVVKVADFGLARAVEASAEDDTAPGQLMATVAYVAPELVTDGHADARTDVYSAGIVLFEMLTGRVPFDGDDPVEVAWQHVDNDVPVPSGVVAGVPDVLDDLVARATRRDPGARPTDAGALLAEVAVVRDDLGAANAETALLRQVPARPAAGRPRAPGQPGSDPTEVVPVVPAGASVPSWARLPKQASPRALSGQRHRGAAARSGLLGKLAAVGGGDRTRLLVMAAVVMMVLTVIGSTWWVTAGRYTDAPPLLSLSRAQAEATATRNGFTLLFGDAVYSETVGKDVVLTQEPSPGNEIVRGGTITLVLSLGPERYPVPDLAGLEVEAAKSELSSARLKYQEGDGRYDEDVPKGIVISSDPKPGTSLKPGRTVTVTVSKGRAPITVPEVTGQNINEARAALQALGLAVVEQYKDSDQPGDQVIGQSPKSGTGVERDTEIKLEVSNGPAQLVLQSVINQPCQLARQLLEAQGLRVRTDGDPNAFVRQQNPPENTPVAPQSEVVIQCR